MDSQTWEISTQKEHHLCHCILGWTSCHQDWCVPLLYVFGYCFVDARARDDRVCRPHELYTCHSPPPPLQLHSFNTIGIEMKANGPNHYQLLGVTRESNPLEIKRAYKKLSLQLHPDKNPAPDAVEQFDKVKQAYDTLMDMELHEVYNKFGKEGVDSNKRYNENQFLLETGIFYVTWGMMAFMLTLGKKSGDARNWTFTGLVVMLVLEITLMTSQTNPLPTWLFPTSTEYDVVSLMHSLFPAFMNGCRSLGAYLYVDLEAQTRQLLLALQEQGKDILLVLRDVQISVSNIQTTGGGGGGNRVTASGEQVYAFGTSCHCYGKAQGNARPIAEFECECSSGRVAAQK